MKRAAIIGDRIYFRPIEREDIDGGWLEWINNPELAINLDGAFPVTRDELVCYFEEKAQLPESMMFAVCDTKTETYFGNVRISNIDSVHRTCIGGRLLGHKDFRGQGYGTEMLRLLLRFAFLDMDMNRVAIGVWIENKASIQSNEKAGMVREGIKRQALFKNGRFCDVVSFAMVRKDFEKLYS